MRKLLLFIALCAAPVGAQSWSTMNVDLAMPFTNSTPGTVLTAAILNSSLSSVNCVPGGGGSTGCSWSTPIPGDTVGANGNGCSNLGPVQVNGGGTLYPTQSMNGNTFARLDTNGNTITQINFGSGIRPTSMSVVACVMPGQPTEGVANNNFTDLLWIKVQSNGKGPLINFVNNGAGSCTTGKIGITIEDPSSGATTLIACVWTNPLPWVSGTSYSSGTKVLDSPVAGSSGPTYGIYQNLTGTNTTTAPHADATNWGYAGPAYFYFISLTYNSAASNGIGYVYTAQGTLLGTATRSLTVNGAVGSLLIFSNENNTDAGITTVTNMMANWTAPQTPMFWTQSDPSAGVIAPSRVPSWTPGVQGGIPTITTQCITAACNALASSVTAANIVSAMQSAPSNTFVSLPSGTFSVGATTITGVAQNVALRGAGANNTVLNMTGGDPSLQVNGSGAGSAVVVSPVSGQPGNLIQGQNQAIFATVSGLKIGNPVIFDEAPTAIDNGGIMVNGATVAYTGPFIAPGNAGPYNEDGTSQGYRGTCQTGTISSCLGLQNQVVFITSCNGVTTVGTACTGTNVTVGFNPPLHMTNWTTLLGMSARWSNTPSMYVGLEDFQINGSGNSGADNIGFNEAFNFWVKGVATIDSSGNSGAPGHIMAVFSGYGIIKNNYFFLTQNHSTSSYGINCSGSSGLLIENNIFHAVASPVMYNGPCNSTVIAYNYDINNYYTPSTGFNLNFNGEHAGGVDTNLLEGNIANQAEEDIIHGTGNNDTFFRNQLSGPQPVCYASGASYATSTYGVCSNSRIAVQAPFPVGVYHRFYNFIGNVLGTAGVNTLYESNGSHCASNCIFEFATDVGFNGFPSADANVLATATIWGNADSATGFNTPRFNCNEIGAGTTLTSFPVSQAYLINPCPSSHTLPASFYYSAKPSWWPAGKAWPIIGPDIAGGNLLLCTGGTQTRALVTAATASTCTSAGGTTSTAMGGLANSNPAMDCYLSLGGLPNGIGSQLMNFNENACYSGGGAQAIAPSCSPGTGAYNIEPLPVTCTDSSGGAIICYTTNGTIPATNGVSGCTNGILYSGAFNIYVNLTLQAIAGGTGFLDSSVVSFTYQFPPAAPTPPMITKLQ